jgi:hypothetical protein
MFKRIFAAAAVFAALAFTPAAWADPAAAPPAKADAAPAQTEAPPAKVDAGPAQTEAPPAKVDAAPAQTEAPPAKADAGPAQAEPPPAKADAVPAQTEPPPAKADAAPAQAVAASAPLNGGFKPGFAMALRLGFAGPGGAVSGVQGADLSKIYDNSFPAQIDLGYRFTPRVSLALYGSYAVASLASNLGCSGTVSCSGQIVRFGAEALLHVAPSAQADPWIGFGLGYEWATVSQSATSTTQSESITLSGFELLNLQLGVDFPASPNFGFGPFVQMSFGQYSSIALSQGSATTSTDIPKTDIHEWFQFGFRGSFSL